MDNTIVGIIWCAISLLQVTVQYILYKRTGLYSSAELRRILPFLIIDGAVAPVAFWMSIYLHADIRRAHRGGFKWWCMINQLDPNLAETLREYRKEPPAEPEEPQYYEK